MTDPIQTNRLAEIPADQLSAAQAAVLERLLGGRGRIPTPYKVWLHSAELAEHLQTLGTFLASRTSLTRREAEIVIMTAAAHWKGEYVFGAHAREAKAAGLTGEVIHAIRAAGPVRLDSPREQTLFDLVNSFAAGKPASDELFAAAVREFGHAGVAETLALFGYFTSVSLAMTLYRVTPA